MTLKLEQLSIALNIPIDDLKDRLANVALSRISDGQNLPEPDWSASFPPTKSVPQLQKLVCPADLPISEPLLPLETTVTDEPTQRLTIDIPASLHQAIKVGCYRRGRTIKDEILVILQNHYCPPA